jgi:hypothetical protein
MLCALDNVGSQEITLPAVVNFKSFGGTTKVLQLQKYLKQNNKII